MRVKPHEQRTTIVAFGIALLLMASYFVLRPVRDAMASDWTDTEVSFLWNIQFFVSTALVSAYGWLVSRHRLSMVVPLVYSFFAISFLLFWVLLNAIEQVVLAEKIFYVWVSAFSLLHVSVFWSLMADRLNKDQRSRLFPVIAAGASAGAILGPLIPTLLANKLGLPALLLLGACVLLLVVPLVLLFQAQTEQFTASGEDHISGARDPIQTVVGGQWWRGFKDVAQNPFLLAIAGFILIYVFIGSFAYFIQKNILADFARAERVQILGLLDWFVNVSTFVLAFFVTGRLLTRLGMPLTLALTPLFLIFGFAALAIAPMVVVLLAVQIARRAGNYAVTRPAREMLFGSVSQEQRFKAKPVIDVVVYRGGDAVSGTVFALLSDGLGLTLAALAAVGAMISSFWATTAVWLGRKYEQQNTYANPSVAPNTVAT